MLFLVRHAHSDYSPDEKRSLSKPGRLGAQRVADLLERREISLIVSSPYTRAIETVQPLADRLGTSIQLDPDLRERHLSPVPLDDFDRCAEASWRDFELTYPGGESNSAAQGRITRAIRRIAEAASESNVVIASHGNVLALFLNALDSQVDYAFSTRMSMPDVYAVELRGETGSYLRIWTGATNFELQQTERAKTESRGA